MTAVDRLTPREGYRRWAPHYERETVVSALDDAIVSRMSIATRERRLIDVGCGVGRRLRDSDASLAVGVDLSPEMLRAGNVSFVCGVATAESLPFPDRSFDVVWCRLVVGHLPSLERVYRELARICEDDGDIIVSDFHPAATRVGHRRTFRDESGVVYEIEHHLHDVDAHRTATARAGLAIVDTREGVVGDAVRKFYAEAGRLDVFEAQRGLPLVLGLHLRPQR